MKQKRALVLLLALALALGAAGCKSEEQIQQAQSQSDLAKQGDTYINVDMRSTLSIAGEGTIKVAPQEATVTLGVSALAESAQEAQQKNAEILTAVTECVKSYSIDEKDISTGEISVSEQYDYESNPPKLTGYVVYADLKVTVRDMTILGSLISDAFAAGATNISGPDYSAGDTNALYQQALAQAVETPNRRRTSLHKAPASSSPPCPFPLRSKGRRTMESCIPPGRPLKILLQKRLWRRPSKCRRSKSPPK